MPELPPPPPPPLSVAGVLADATRRAVARAGVRTARPWAASSTGDDATVPGTSPSPSTSPLVSAAPPLLLAGAALAVVVVGGWFLLQRFAGGSTPPEITLPRAGASVAATGPGVSSGPADGSSDGSPPDAAAGAGPGGGAPRGPVTVHAAGAVARPGVYRLPPGARVADLIDAAGGATADAEVDALNLAARLDDGRRVYVPQRGELPPGALVAGAAMGDGDGAGGLAGSGSDPVERPVDLNTATLEQLDALPGVGPTTARAIIDHRRANGRFRSVDELLEVRGIGPSRLQALRKKVRV